MIAFGKTLFANGAVLLASEPEEGNAVVSLIGKLIEKMHSYFQISFRLGWGILVAGLVVAVALVLYRYHKKVSRN